MSSDTTAVTGSVQHDVNPIFRSFIEGPVVDRTIRKKDYVEIQDQEGNSNINNKAKITFNANPSNEFYLLSESYIEATMRIEYARDLINDDFNDAGEAQADGYDSADPRRLLKSDKTVGVGNPLFLFDEVRLTVNNYDMETIQDPGIAYHVKNLIETPSSVLKSYGDSCGFIPDTNAHWVSDVNNGEWQYLERSKYNGNGEHKFETYNDGYARRFRRWRIRDDGYVSFQIPLSTIFDFATQTNVPITAIPLKLEFNRSRNHEMMVLSDTSVGATYLEGLNATFADFGYRINLTEFRLWMCVVTPSDMMNAAIYTLMSQDAENDIMYENTTIKRLRPFTGASNVYEVDIDSMKQIPTAVSLVFIDQRALSANNPKDMLQVNPCHFHNLDIKEVQFRIGNVLVPSHRHSVDFNEGSHQYMRLYRDFLESTKNCAGKTCTESIISYEQFKKVSTIIHCDLSHIDTTMFDLTNQHTLKASIRTGRNPSQRPYPDPNPDAPLQYTRVFQPFALVSNERIVTIKTTRDRKTLINFQAE